MLNTKDTINILAATGVSIPRRHASSLGLDVALALGVTTQHCEVLTKRTNYLTSRIGYCQYSQGPGAARL